MNSLNQFLLIVSVLLAVEAAHKRLSSKPDGCPIKFPDGFFCNLICQEWHMLKGNTVMCFVSNNGEYHRLIGRNPAFGIWRFYKVDETSDVSSLCRESVKADTFYLNKTDVMCSNNEPPMTTLLPHEDTTTEYPDVSQEESPSSESDPDSKRFSLKDLIQKINNEVAKLFPGKKETEPEAPEAPAASAHRSALARSSSANDTKSNYVPPMDDVCQLVMTDVCRQQKVIICETGGDCCWAQIDFKTCTSESLTQENECYKGLGVVMAAVQH